MIDDAYIKENIKYRREEASEVKRCYTDFTFKALLLAIVFFGFIIEFYPIGGSSCIQYLLVWLLCGAMILVLMCISRIGYHKYSTANRHYGYELHINRTYDYQKLPENGAENLERAIREIGWEEAMCAWRVCQPIIFEAIYQMRSRRERLVFPFFGIERPFKDQEYHWWNTEFLLNCYPSQERLSYHPGRYLRNTQVLLHIISGAIYLIFSISYGSGFSCIRDGMLAKTGWQNHDILFGVIYGVIWLLLTLVFARYIARHHARRRILEKGLLSIQSCAVVWRLVALAHRKAVEKGFRIGLNYQGYTGRLAENACIIRENLFDIHEKIMKNIWPPLRSEGTWNKEIANGDLPVPQR